MTDSSNRSTPNSLVPTPVGHPLKTSCLSLEVTKGLVSTTPILSSSGCPAPSTRPTTRSVTRPPHLGECYFPPLVLITYLLKTFCPSFRRPTSWESLECWSSSRAKPHTTLMCTTPSCAPTG